MILLHIEHEVPSFEGWKKAFDSDPLNRKKSGVRRYKIFQLIDNPNFVVVDLEFDDLKEAEDSFAALQILWKKVEGKIMANPQTRMLKLIESKDI
jgi:hypothetical protein